MFDQYRIIPWDQTAGRGTFSCGQPEIDAYWRAMAVRHARAGLAAVTVMEELATNEVVGFYTMAGYTLVVESLPEHVDPRKLPRNLPTTMIGKLAIAANRQRQGLGSLLLAHAIKTALDASVGIGSFAIVVDAIDVGAARFYQRFGFRPLTERPSRLLLTLADARASRPGS